MPEPVGVVKKEVGDGGCREIVGERHCKKDDISEGGNRGRGKAERWVTQTVKMVGVGGEGQRTAGGCTRSGEEEEEETELAGETLKGHVVKSTEHTGGEWKGGREGVPADSSAKHVVGDQRGRRTVADWEWSERRHCKKDEISERGNRGRGKAERWVTQRVKMCRRGRDRAENGGRAGDVLEVYEEGEEEKEEERGNRGRGKAERWVTQTVKMGRRGRGRAENGEWAGDVREGVYEEGEEEERGNRGRGKAERWVTQTVKMGRRGRGRAENGGWAGDVREGVYEEGEEEEEEEETELARRTWNGHVDGGRERVPADSSAKHVLGRVAGGQGREVGGVDGWARGRGGKLSVMDNGREGVPADSSAKHVLGDQGGRWTVAVGKSSERRHCKKDEISERGNRGRGKAERWVTQRVKMCRRGRDRAENGGRAGDVLEVYEEGEEEKEEEERGNRGRGKAERWVTQTVKMGRRGRGGAENGGWAGDGEEEEEEEETELARRTWNGHVDGGRERVPADSSAKHVLGRVAGGQGREVGGLGWLGGQTGWRVARGGRQVGWGGWVDRQDKMCHIKPTTGEGASAMKRRIPGGHAESASETCLDWPVTLQLRRMSEIVEGGGTADDGGEEKWPSELERLCDAKKRTYQKRKCYRGAREMRALGRREESGKRRRWREVRWQRGGREVAADGSGGIVGGGAAVLLAWQVQVTLQSECVTCRLEGRTVEGRVVTISGGRGLLMTVLRREMKDPSELERVCDAQKRTYQKRKGHREAREKRALGRREQSGKRRRWREVAEKMAEGGIHQLGGRRGWQGGGKEVAADGGVEWHGPAPGGRQ
ncbi:hypothetical protein BXZ70DRAFT_907521 [Cristinia sonorae]|uniref:Uncharacterized protein n=1 Tax=Cristinia sonorae TaxID=1940300 RepID=A0A8K0UQG6_9AGAR|nr:hypothetical protein BXZ70DRAFT_907521 [Cristinia sonorae]